MLRGGTLAGVCRARRRLLGLDDVEPPTVAALAREAGLSNGHFIGLFAAMFGETPHQARTRARLERAKVLLAADHASVTDVCMTLGFSSLGSFSAMFARRVGTTPSAYRRHVRTLVQVPADITRVLTPGCLGLMGQAWAQLGARTRVFEKHGTTAGARVQP